MSHEAPSAEITARTLFLIIMITAAAFIGGSFIMTR
jgi:hypothetical protein